MTGLEMAIVIAGLVAAGAACRAAGIVIDRRVRGRARRPPEPKPSKARPPQARDVEAPAGLSITGLTERGFPMMSGKVAGYQVRVEPAEDRQGDQVVRVAVRITVDGGGKFPQGLTAFRRGTEAVSPRLPPCPTGDPAFDEEVAVHGWPEHAQAALGSHERFVIAEHVRRSVVSGRGVTLNCYVHDGSVVADLAEEPDPALLGELIHHLVDCAQGLSSAGASAANRLLRNANRDPSPEVRARCHRVLAAEPKGMGVERRRKAHRKGLKDPDPRVRLEAAAGLGREGRKPLEALASDPSTPPGIRVAAVSHLREPSMELVDAALACIPSGGEAEDVLRLARTLASREDARAESALLLLLERESPEDRLAAVRALKDWGGVRSVPPLMRLSKGSRLDALEMWRESREAIAAIQARLGDVDAGRLALAEIDAAGGELSAAPAAGELSEPPATGAVSEAAHECPAPRAAPASSRGSRP